MTHAYKAHMVNFQFGYGGLDYCSTLLYFPYGVVAIFAYHFILCSLTHKFFMARLCMSDSHLEMKLANVRKSSPF